MLSTPAQISAAEVLVQAAQALSAALAAYGNVLLEEGITFSDLDDHQRDVLLDGAHGAFRVTALFSTDLSIAAKAAS